MSKDRFHKDTEYLTLRNFTEEEREALDAYKSKGFTLNVGIRDKIKEGLDNAKNGQFAPNPLEDLFNRANDLVRDVRFDFDKMLEEDIDDNTITLNRYEAEPILKILSKEKTEELIKELGEPEDVYMYHEDLDIPQEMYDWTDVLEMGAKKYGANNWLEPDGKNANEKNTHASMFRHLAKSSAGIINDEESGLDHLLHVACRALMLYTRRKRNIIHKEDKL